MNRDEQAIRQLVADWHTFTAAGNVEGVLRLMAEDVVFLVARQPPMEGRSNFERGLRKLLASHSIQSTSDVQEVEVSGNLAYCWSVLRVEMVSLGDRKVNVRSGNALTILHKQADDSWVVVRDANMLTVET